MSLFTKKDLGLLLPDDAPGDPVSLRHTKTRDQVDTLELPKPKIDASKRVARYRPGQVPAYATGYEEEKGFVRADNQVRKPTDKNGAAKPNRRARIEAQVVQIRSKSTKDSTSETVNEPTQIGTESIASSHKNALGSTMRLDSSSDSEQEQEQDFDQRRKALRERMLRQQEQQQQQPTQTQTQTRADKAVSPSSSNSSSSSSSSSSRASITTPDTSPGQSTMSVRPKLNVTTTSQAGQAQAATSLSSSGDEEDDDEGSEWETDTSSEQEELMKPVFVPKKARETIKKQEEMEAMEEKKYQEQLKKLEDRKKESRQYVAQEIQRDLEKDSNALDGDVTDGEMPDDTDGLDPEQEYKDWELREMRRLKRDRDERLKREQEAQETLQRRNMTEEEREAENRKLKKNEPKDKAKWKFMQKYYHKGAFYMDDDSVRIKDDVRKRDASGATLEDKFNKELMPKVMQVKNFGRAGRTKYTHLLDQDTSTKDSLWGRHDEIRNKYTSKLSGMRDIEASHKRRKTNNTTQEK